ncbi:MAG: hypothetical protein OQL09_07410, partial [Gammaproteobacteria bacterium]|nr:hypothetical protein [Gammaproteobacteria bacterium]
MKNQYKTINALLFILTVIIFASPVAWAKGKPGGTDTVTQVYDTSFAVEFSYSCLSGGCHETNQQLV